MDGPMEMSFTLEFEVNDQRLFFEAALDSFLESDGADLRNVDAKGCLPVDAFCWQFFLLDDGSPDWTKCAIELLDPGCAFDHGYGVINSHAEIVPVLGTLPLTEETNALYDAADGWRGSDS